MTSAANSGSALHGRATDTGVKLEGVLAALRRATDDALVRGDETLALTMIAACREVREAVRLSAELADARSGIYVASRASVPARPAMWRLLRDRFGLPIISTWIDEAGEGETACNRELWSRIEHEVTSAERLVFYVEPEDLPLKGAYIEVGMALAAGVPVFVVAPGVKLEPVTMRPLGSWTRHPLVRFCDTVEIACRAALHTD